LEFDFDAQDKRKIRPVFCQEIINIKFPGEKSAGIRELAWQRA
jgi:hypothetical protein